MKWSTFKNLYIKHSTWRIAEVIINKKIHLGDRTTELNQLTGTKFNTNGELK